VSQQPAFPVFCFERQKVPYPASSFLPDIKLSWRKSHYTINMVEWEVTRHYLPTQSVASQVKVVEHLCHFSHGTKLM